MYERLPEESVKTRVIHKAGWIRAAESGIFIWSKSSGNTVEKGDYLGTISSPQGDRITQVIAKKDGLIIGHNNASVVHSGDALFHIGYEDE
jgi:predicted deacylase